MQVISRRTRIIIGALAALAASAAFAYGATCPIDNSSAYFTGETRIDVSGVLLKKYKCNQFGHVFWAKD